MSGVNIRCLLPAMAIVLLLSGLAPFASADHDSLHIVVLVEDRQYSIGSSCRVTVHAMEKNEHVDVDNVPDVKVGAYFPRFVSVERTDKGIYQGTFKIDASDALNNFVRIEASATRGRTNPNSTVYDASTDATSIFVSNSSGGAIEVLLYTRAVSDPVITGGTKVTVRGEVVLLDANIEPTGFGFSAFYYDALSNLVTDTFDAKNVSTGKFEGTYTFPQLSYNADVTITATARYFNDTATRSLTISSSNFQVLYHNLARGANQSSFELYIADPYGNPVQGADVSLNYWPDNRFDAQKDLDLGTTDPLGRVTGSVEYDNGTRDVQLFGNVNSSGHSQSFTAQLQVPGAQGILRASGAPFEAVYAGPDRIYTPGKKMVREYAVFNNSTPWESQDVWVYITSARINPDRPLQMSAVKLLQAGSYKTDASGRLQVSFDTPSDSSYIFLDLRSVTGQHPKQSEAGHYSTDGLYYSDDSDTVVSAQMFTSSDVTIEASPLKIGTPLSVKATLRGGADDVAVSASWLPGAFDPYTPAGTGTYDWQMWSGVLTYLNRSGNDFSGRVTIPSFMPKDVKFTMVVYAGARNSTMSGFGTASLIASQPVVPPAPIPWLYIVIIVVIVAAVGGGAAYAIRSRRMAAMAPPKAPAPAAGAAVAPAQAAPRTVQLTITCPNCRTPFAATRGPAPTRIKCPKCGTEGTLPPLPQQPAPAAAPAGAPQPGAMPEVKMPLDCPKCGTHFEVTRGYSPTRIKCPSCGTEGTLPPLARPAMPAVAPAPAPAGAPAPSAPAVAPAPVVAPAPAPTTPVPAARADMAAAPTAPAAVQYKTISCPRCKKTFTIEKKEGPQQIKCPHCGKEGTIGKPAAGAPLAPAPVATPPAAPPAPRLPPAVPLSAVPPPRHPAPGRMITCPTCHVPFPVSDTRRPLSVRCPNCGKEGVLRK